MSTQVEKRLGFTLIELLVVIVVIGILAAVAVGRYQKVRTRGFVAATESDLSNVIRFQEMYHADSLTYASTVASLGQQLSPGVAVNITESSSTGWAAVATHAADPGISCGIFVGSAAQSNAGPAVDKEVINCTW